MYKNGTMLTGFLENNLENVCKTLGDESISFMVIVKGNVVDGMSFDDKNKFKEFAKMETNYPINDRGNQNNTDSFLSEEEKKLCDISITYIERMMEGRHPVNNSILDEESVLNNENVQKCFGFVAGLLKRVKNQPKFVVNASYGRTKIFEFQPNYREVIDSIVKEEELPVSKFEALVNKHAGELFVEKPDKISFVRISNWLIDNGYLTSVKDDMNNSHREATEKGINMGMTNNIVKHDDNNSYVQYRFTTQGQRFILKNLAAIVKYKKKK
jgi:hypothetical protein